MITSRPLSTISYNSPNYLMHTLKYLIDSHRIDDYRVILHFPEESTKKEHYHLLIYPSKRIDSSYLDSIFTEPDPQNPDLPLKCLPWRTSDPLNWLLYVLHDSDYLASHLSTSAGDGKIEYGLWDLVCFCREYLEADYMRAYSVRTSTSQKALQLALNGYSYAEILATVPNINPSSLLAIVNGVARGR